MKRDIHPAYGPVVFRDKSAAVQFVTRSTLASGATERVDVDGRTLPVVDVEISSASHPFWTGRGRVVDTEGRVDRFRRRYEARAKGGTNQ